VEEYVQMPFSTTFIMKKPAISPPTPEEAEAGEGPWNGFYTVEAHIVEGDVGLDLSCEGSGRTVGEHASVYIPGGYVPTARGLIVVENPSRDSGLEVRLPRP